jgi:hypothetical protein
LSRLEHVPELDADQRALGCRKRFEPQHGTSDPFDDAVGLRYDMLPIGHLTDDDRRTVCLIVPRMAAALASLPSMVIVSGMPWRRGRVILTDAEMDQMDPKRWAQCLRRWTTRRPRADIAT